jgi:hypothetical protein
VPGWRLPVGLKNSSLNLRQHRDARMAADRALWHRWLQIERLIRSILETRWDNKTRPIAKATLKQALEERKKIRRAGWWN